MFFSKKIINKRIFKNMIRFLLKGAESVVIIFYKYSEGSKCGK